MADPVAHPTPIGRREILEDVLRAITERARGTELSLIHVHGVAGIGKTTIVDALIRRLREAGTPVARLAAYGLEPRALEVDRALDAVRAQLDAAARGAVLILDPADELLGLLPHLLRRSADPDLRFHAIVTVARRPLPATLRVDALAGLRIASFEVGPLARQDTIAALASWGTPAAIRDLIATRIGGHPLSLAIASASSAAESDEAEVQAAIGVAFAESMARLVDQIPSDAHVRTLLLAACVPVIDEAAIAQANGGDRASARQTLGWLAGLPFVRRSSEGLVIHDVVRPIVVESSMTHHQDLVCETYEQGFRRLRQAIATHSEDAVARAVAEFAQMLALHPALRSTFGEANSSYRIESPDRATRVLIHETIARCEGARSADRVEGWLEEPGVEAAIVVDETGVPRAFSLTLTNDVLARGDRGDPVVRSLLGVVSRRGATSSLLVRAWGSFDRYQDPTDPWNAATMQAMTRCTLRLLPTLGATCHRADPAYASLLERLYSAPGSGYVHEAVECDDDVSFAFQHDEDLDTGSFWRRFWNAPDASDPSSPNELARPNVSLSERELEVLKLLAEGYRYDQIASLLAISLGTVRTYVRRTYTKLGTATKSEATLIATRLGLIR